MLRIAVATLLSVIAAACGPPEGGADPPAGRAETAEPGASPLAARVEAALRARAPELRANLSHYALLHPVDAAEIEARLAGVQLARDRFGVWLGAGGRVEPHGGGIVAFLFRHWRPNGRAARPDDIFPFPASRRGVALGTLYDAHRRRVVLPAETEEGATFPRMRFLEPVAGGARSVERDAHLFLGLLVAREPDLAAVWTGADGREVSVDRLLGRVRDVFLAGPPPVFATDAEIDHSHLHAVELLLAWHARSLAEGRPPPVDPEAVKHRFLAVDPCRRPARDAGDAAPGGPADGECVAHRVESLGRLAADPHVRFTPAERAAIAGWLAALDRAWPRDLASVPVEHLAHLAKGLRLLAHHPLAGAPIVGAP